jgi:hypothetical protein
MGSKILGVVCVLFSAYVFVYFTLWTFVVPLVRTDSAPLLVAAFPPRIWLLGLPYAGVLLLAFLVATFVHVCSRRVESERTGSSATTKTIATNS